MESKLFSFNRQAGTEVSNKFSKMQADRREALKNKSKSKKNLKNGKSKTRSGFLFFNVFGLNI